MSAEAPRDGESDVPTESFVCGTPFVSFGSIEDFGCLMPEEPSGWSAGESGAAPPPPGSSRTVLGERNMRLGTPMIGGPVDLIPVFLRPDEGSALLPGRRAITTDWGRVSYVELPGGSVRVRNDGARPCLLTAGSSLHGLLPPERLPWYGFQPWLREDVLVGARDEVVVPASPISAAEFLGSLATDPSLASDAVGLGTELEICTRETVGRVIELDGRLVHATARITPE